MVTDAIELLRSLGVPGARLHRELFWVGDEPPAEATTRRRRPARAPR